jgi:hypothetical protein
MLREKTGTRHGRERREGKVAEVERRVGRCRDRNGGRYSIIPVRNFQL